MQAVAALAVVACAGVARGRFAAASTRRRSAPACVTLVGGAVGVTAVHDVDPLARRCVRLAAPSPHHAPALVSRLGVPGLGRRPGRHQLGSAPGHGRRLPLPRLARCRPRLGGRGTRARLPSSRRPPPRGHPAQVKADIIAGGEAESTEPDGALATISAGGRSADSVLADFDRARDIVTRRSTGTLDYFALRSDKQLFFAQGQRRRLRHLRRRLPRVARPDRAGGGAGAAVGGVPAASPTSTAGRWPCSAAGEEWLPIYHQSGMRDLYIGDEAVVDVRTMSLARRVEEGAPPGRQPHRQVRLHDQLPRPRRLRPGARRGDAGRDDPEPAGRRRAGLLHDARADLRPARRRAAARRGVGPGRRTRWRSASSSRRPGIGGYSLDLMRRDNGEHPNGLFDFILVRTIEQLRDDGSRQASASTSPRCVPCSRARPATASRRSCRTLAPPQDVRLDADRVLVAVQRQVRPGMAAPLRRVGLSRAARWPAALAIARAE